MIKARFDRVCAVYPSCPVNDDKITERADNTTISAGFVKRDDPAAVKPQDSSRLLGPRDWRVHIYE
jgi:hypothetical protein